MRSALCVCALIAVHGARAGHYAGGSITWECIGAGQYEIHLDLFLDCSGFMIIPQDIVFSSDCGTTYTVEDLLPVNQQEVSQLCAAELANSTCNGGALPGIMWYEFVTVQTLPPCDSWNVSWNICCRSNAVNLVGNQGMFIEAEINTLDAACDNSPVFTDQSLPYVCVNQPVYYNFGVNDPDGSVLAYSLVSGQLFAGTVQNLNYQGGFNGAQPVSGITVDPITGQIVFTPTVSGNYVVVMQVEEYDNNGNLIGVVMRDITFVVIPCTGNVPQTQGVVNNTGGILTGPNSIEVCDGEAFCVDVLFTDADPGTVLQVVSQAASLLPGSSFNVTGTNPATARLCWTGSLANSPVNVLIQADDGSCPIENTASIAVNITTVSAGGAAPSPGTNGSVQVCPGSGAFFLISVLGGTPDVNGYWLDPSGNPHNADLNPLTDVPGVYTYVVGTACASATATATISFLAAPNAGTDSNLTLCSNAAPSALLSALGGTPDTGGSWTAPGGGPFGGTYDPAIHAPGTYTYTVAPLAGCLGASATVTVLETTAPDPGIDGSATFCSNGGAQGLIAFLSGSPQAGGIWTAPGGGAFGGSYNPTVHAPGAYTYTVPGTAPCTNASATVTVDDNPVPVAGTSGSITVCSNAVAFSLHAQLGGAPAVGGVWTAPGGGVHSATYDPAFDIPGVYIYTLTGTAPCPNAAATVTVSENLAPNAGADGTLSVCGNGATVNLVDQLVGAQSNGTWTAPGGAPFLGTYNPSTDAPGVYTYTVPGIAPCLVDQAIVTVSESNLPNAGTDGSLAICGNNLSTNLNSLLIGAQPGGTWTGPGGAPFSGFYDPAIDASGVYTYTVAGVAPCPSDAATVTVTENAPPFAGSAASITLCSTSPVTALFPLLAGAQGGGSWTAPGNIAFSGVYDPTVYASGVYTYTVPGISPCLIDAASVTVTEHQQPVAGADTDLALCASSAATDLLPLLVGAQAGGTWAAPGGAPFGGVYDPTLHTSGAYTYTLPGSAPCVNAQAIVTVTENPVPNAGGDGALTLCGNSVATPLFPQLAGADPGGVWTSPGGGASTGTYDPVVDGPGDYTYTVNGILPCVADQAIVTITEQPVPDAGTDGALDLCSNSLPTGLFASLTGAQPGGTWTGPAGGAFGGTYDPAVDGPGAYTYTVIGISPCFTDQAVVTVAETAAPNAGSDASFAVCDNSPPAALFPVLGGADPGGVWTAPGGGSFSGTYDPSVDAPGDHTYTVSGTGPCPSAQSLVTVVESAAPNAGADGVLSICGSAAPEALFPLLAGAQAGGLWAAPGGGVFTGTYDPTLHGPGTYIYTITGVSPCADDAATVIVTEDMPSDATVVYGSPSLCADQSLQTATVTGTPGGVFSSTPVGLGLDAISGSIDPAASVPGNYSVTYALPSNGSCPAFNGTAAIAVIEPPAAGADASLTVCDNGGPVVLFTSLTGAQPGGTWTGPGGGAFMGTYDPAIHASGQYTYTLVGTAPCVDDLATVTVTETGSPDAGTDGVLTVCANGPAIGLFAALGGTPGSGGTWTGPGGAPHSGTIDPSTDVTGIYLYTLTATAPCISDQSEVALTINAAPVAGSDGTITVCDAGAPVALFPELTGAEAGGGWTAPGGGAFSGIYDPSVDAGGVYTYTVNGISPCGSDQAIVTVNGTGSPNAGADGAITLCSTSAATGLFAELTGAQAGGSWTAPGGAAHSGVFDPATDPPGAYTYTLAATAPCLSDQSQVVVTLVAAPEAGIDGSLTVCEQGAPTALSGQLSGADAGGAWSAPGGGAFSGTYDPATDVGGVYTYTVSGNAPCLSDQATVTVNETGAPDAGTDGALALCSYDAVTPLFNALVGADPGGTWTAPGGVPHGSSFDPDSDPAGVYTYTIAATAPCSGDQAQVTVTVSQAANAGADGALTVCDAGTPVGLITALPGAPVGGTWTAPGGGAFSGTYVPAADAPGVYTYTVNGIAPCVADQATVTVTETGSPDAGSDGSLTLCLTSATADLFAQLVGAQSGGTWAGPGGLPHSGSFDPLVDQAGDYTYTLAAAAPCIGDLAQVSVAVIAPPNAGADGSLAVCDQGAPTPLGPALTGADPGGTWTAPGGGSFSGIYDPSTDPDGIYTYTVNGTAPCGAEQATVTVNETGSPYAGADGTITICTNGLPVGLIAGATGAQAGGTWTAPDGLPHSGFFDPSTDGVGPYTYTLSAAAPCLGDQSVVDIVLVTAPSAGADASLTVCDQGAGTGLFGQLIGADTGGTWTDPSGQAFNGSYDPALNVPGAYTYTVNGMSPCLADQSVVTVSETGSPDAGTDGVLAICSSTGPTQLLDQLGVTAGAGGSWTAPGGTAHSGTLVPALDAAGIYTYTIITAAPCLSSSANVTVTIEAAPDAGIDGGFTVCTGDPTFPLFGLLGGTPQANGVWTDILNVPFDGVFDPAVSPQGMYTYTVPGMVCPSDLATVQVNVVLGPNAGQDNAIAFCETDAPIQLIGVLGGQPDVSGVWSGPDGQSFNGILDPAVAQSGDYTYTVLTSGGGCPDAQGIVSVTVSGTVNAGSVGNVTLCSTNAPVQLLGQLGGSPDPGGTWVDPVGAPFAGIFDPASGPTGVYTYTVEAVAPCPSASTSVNVEVNTQPQAGNDASVLMCSTDGTVALASSLGGAFDPGGVWTAPGGSPSNGQFVPGTSVPGNYTYLMAGISPCINDQAVVSVAVAQAANVGADGSIAVCADAAPFPLYPLLGPGTDGGGVWTAPDGSPINGVIQPTTDISGTYTYSLSAPAPCPQVQGDVVVVINEVPAPVIAFLMADGCAPVEVTFSNSHGDEGTYAWDFGNGSTDQEVLPGPVLYAASGEYLISLTVTSMAGCTGDAVLTDGLAIYTRPAAAFSFGPSELNTNAPDAYFQNQSIGANTYDWQFDDQGSSTEVNPRYTFPSALEGVYTVCLTAYASDNCYDTTCVEIPVPMGAGLFVPNAFSPDGDGINEMFTPVVSGLKDQGYEFLVFDRWGRSIFSSTRAGEGWDGNYGDGSPVPIGVYIWKLIGRERYGTGRVDRTGHVTLVR